MSRGMITLVSKDSEEEKGEEEEEEKRRRKDWEEEQYFFLEGGHFHLFLRKSPKFRRRQVDLVGPPFSFL